MTTTRRFVLALTLLWLAGNALRMTILAVPPVIPALREALSLSGTEIGILVGLPIVLFAAAALPGSLLIARFGALAALIVGLVVTAAGSALRAAAPDTLWLFAATVVMGAGVAVSQPAIPALVRNWLPHKIGLGTAVYTSGLLFGEIFPVVSFPVLFAWLGESWRAVFVFWAVPVAVIAAVALFLSPRDVPATGTRPRWWPDWSNPVIWRAGFIFGSVNAAYYAANAFIPGHLTDNGRADLIAPALAGLNSCQIPAALLLIAFSSAFERKVWPFVVTIAITVAAMGWVALTADITTVIAAGILGFSAGGTFALGLTLPPLLSPSHDVARMSAAMFTVSYTLAVCVSVIGGVAWDIGGLAAWAFLPIILANFPALWLLRRLRFSGHH